MNVRNTNLKLDYQSLFALAAVVQEGSFERAARMLHVTPSAVSQRIRALEERMGCAVVTRGQPCEATEAGRWLCQHVDRVRLLEQELYGAIPALRQDTSTRVKVPVAVNADSLATWFVPAAAALSAKAAVLVQLSIDDEVHTADWLRSGAVLAAVTATAEPAAGCNSQLLGAMRYVAAASPAFIAQHFPKGLSAQALQAAPSLRFNTKDQLQERWVQHTLGLQLELPHHTLPSSHAFVAASLGGMGWAMHPKSLIKEQLKAGQLRELVRNAPLDVPLYWQQARMASAVLKDLSEAVFQAARTGLRQFQG